MSYECAGGSLKLKGISDKKIKKKKSKSTLKSLDTVVNTIKADTKLDSEKLAAVTTPQSISNAIVINKPIKTKAELAFEKYNQKKIQEKIIGRAEKSHKEHVEVYNRHLDSLTEYNDIPKVSWTK